MRFTLFFKMIYEKNRHIDNTEQVKEIIRNRLINHQKTINNIEKDNSNSIFESVKVIKKTFSNGGTVFSIGNGGSAADSMHFASELSGNYRDLREPKSAISLSSDSSAITCIANDFDFSKIFSRQIEAHFKKKDTLFAISTSGKSANVMNAVKIAKKIGGKTILLTSDRIIDLKDFSMLSDILIRCPAIDTAAIQEFHKIVIHILVEAILDVEQ